MTRNRGFMLTELLISGALGVVVLFATMSFYSSTVQFARQNDSQTYLQRQGELILEEMARQFRPATALQVTSCSGVGSALLVTQTNPAGAGNVTYCFRLDAAGGTGLVEDRPDGSSFDLLMGPPVPLSLTGLSFNVVTPAPPGKQYAAIQFGLQDGVGNTMEFQTTLTRRN